MSNIGIYGRFSTIEQSSIEAQFHVIRLWAEQKGHVITRIYEDPASSGATLAQRPGILQALHDASLSPRPIDILVADQLSRISRSQGDTHFVIARLHFHDVTLFCVNDHIDTSDENSMANVTFKSFANENLLKDVRKTVKRTLDAKFKDGYSTGGRPYGFRSVTVHDPVARTPRGGLKLLGYRLEIDPAQAPIVKKIFEYYRSGMSHIAVTFKVNAEYPERIWSRYMILNMLRNSKYIGHITYNRSRSKTNPDTGKKAFPSLPQEQWLVRTDESLRIIDDETWEDVQHRLDQNTIIFAHRHPASVHLLAGKLFCDKCGGGIHILARDEYGCRKCHTMGACSNDIRMRRAAIENVVISALVQHLPRSLDMLRKAVYRETLQPNDPEICQRINHLRTESKNLTQLVRKGSLSGRAQQETERELQQLWDEISTLEKKLANSAPTTRITEVRYHDAVLAKFLVNLPDVLNADIKAGSIFLGMILEKVSISAVNARSLVCPVCQFRMAKFSPRHLAKHGLTVPECFKRFPRLGFTHDATVTIHFKPEGLLNKKNIDCIEVTGTPSFDTVDLPPIVISITYAPTPSHISATDATQRVILRQKECSPVPAFHAMKLASKTVTTFPKKG